MEPNFHAFPIPVTSLEPLKTYFFKLHLDNLSNFHENLIRSYSGQTGKELSKAFWLIKQFSNNVDEFNDDHSEMDVRLYLLNVYSDQT